MASTGSAKRDRIRFAVIGLGWVGTEREIPNLLRHPEIELLGVIDRMPKRAERIARQLRLKHWAACEDGNASWMENVDAVTVATPPHSHYALARAMLKMGKHVLLEKPMAMNVEEGRELLTISQSEKRILAMIHNFQFTRSLRTLQKKIQRGEIGEIQSILAVQLSNPARRLPQWYEDLPLGLYYDESPHMLYLIRRLALEEPRLVSAQIVPSTLGKKTPASVTAHFRAGPVPLQVYMNFEAPVSEWHLLVFGSKRLAVADLFRDILVVTRNDGSHRAGEILRTTWDALRTHLQGVMSSGLLLTLGRLRYGSDEVLTRFVQAIRQNKPPEFISGVDGLRVLELQHQVMDQGQRI